MRIPETPPPRPFRLDERDSKKEVLSSSRGGSGGGNLRPNSHPDEWSLDEVLLNPEFCVIALRIKSRINGVKESWPVMSLTRSARSTVYVEMSVKAKSYKVFRFLRGCTTPER